MINILKKTILFILAIIIFAYIAFCDVVMTVSFSMNFCFITMGILLLLLHYVINNPIDKKENPPSFLYIFIKVSTIIFFASIISITLFNVLYPKKTINENDQKYDYIIVFGAGITEGKNEIINTRLDTAVEYAKKYKNCKFVLTGAKGEKEPMEEAVYMRNYMVERGIDDKNILTDTLSINTYENIYNSLTLIKKDVKRRNTRENIITRPFRTDDDKFDVDFLNIGFMSSEFHLTRINLMAKAFGIRRPYDIACKTKTFYKPYLYIREDLSLLKAFVLNQMKL